MNYLIKLNSAGLPVSAKSALSFHQFKVRGDLIAYIFDRNSNFLILANSSTLSTKSAVVWQNSN